MVDGDYGDVTLSGGYGTYSLPIGEFGPANQNGEVSVAAAGNIGTPDLYPGFWGAN
jgi:hypothetical protein